MIKFIDLPQEIKDAALRESQDIHKRITLRDLPDELAIRRMEESIARNFASFGWMQSDIKYGATPSKRYDFWSNIFVYGDFKEFYEKFPKKVLEEVKIDNVKYVL